MASKDDRFSAIPSPRPHANRTKGICGRQALSRRIAVVDPSKHSYQFMNSSTVGVQTPNAAAFDPHNRLSFSFLFDFVSLPWDFLMFCVMPGHSTLGCDERPSGTIGLCGPRVPSRRNAVVDTSLFPARIKTTLCQTSGFDQKGYKRVVQEKYEKR